MNRFILTLCFCTSIYAFSFSQVVSNIPVDSAQIKEYERRTKLTRIDGKYIPKDLNDALMELDKIMLNLGLPCAEVEVTYIRLGEATLNGGNKCVQQLLDEIISVRTSVMYIHLGENDIKSLSSHVL